MSNIQIILFGNPCVTAAGRPIPFSGKKMAVLAMLALSNDKSVNRAVLQTQIWPASALGNNLNVALSNIRKDVLGSEAKRLEKNGTSIIRLALEPDDCDVLRFDKAYHAYKRSKSITDAEAAAAIGAFPFMNGYTEDCLIAKRAEYDRKLSEVLIELAKAALASGQPRNAMSFGSRLLESDSFFEEGLRIQMRALSRTGNVAGALELFEQLRANLRAKHINLVDETIRLAEKIKREASRAEASVSESPIGAHALPAMSPVSPSVIKGRRFMGHDRELTHLSAALSDTETGPPNIVGLYGMRGVGKTQVALKYASENRNAYVTGVFWLPVSTRQAMYTSLSDHGMLQCPGIMVPGRDDLSARQFCQWLSKQGNYLIIADNVEDRGVLRDLSAMLEIGNNPAGVHQGIIFTTHIRHLLPEARTIDVRTFPDNIGAEFVWRRATDKWEPYDWNMASTETKADATALTQRLGGLPLALDQAGAYLQDTGSSFSWYMNRYDDYRREGTFLRGTRDGMNNADEQTEHEAVRATFQFIFDRMAKDISSEGTASLDLLRILAILNADNVPESLLRYATPVDGLLHDLAKDDTRWKAVLGHALRYSIIDRSSSPGFLSLHRVVQDVLRDRLSSEGLLKVYVEKVAQMLDTRMDQVRTTVTSALHYARWQPLKELLPHFISVVDLAAKEDVSDKAVVGLLNELGLWSRYNEMFGDAETYARRALDMARSEFGAFELPLAYCLQNLATPLEKLGQRDEALRLMVESIRIREQQQPPQPAVLANGLNNLAEFHREGGNVSEATSLHRQALHLRQEVLPQNPVEIAQSQQNLALALYAAKAYEEAEVLFRNALATQQDKYGDSDITAYGCSNLSMLLMETGRLLEAETLSRRAFNMLHPLFNSNNSRVQTVTGRWLRCINLLSEHGVEPEVPYDLASVDDARAVFGSFT